MAARRKVDLNKELGGTGTVITSGIISDQDYNSELTGYQGIKRFDEMRKGDATVRAALLSVKLPILAANWYIEPASEDQADIDVADYVQKALFEDMELTWDEFLRHALLYLDYGRMVFELVYKLDDKGFITWEKFAPRLPETIQAWEMPDGESGIQQFLPTGGDVSIPIEKLIIFVNEKEGDNWEGISILRSAFKHWYMKDNLYKIDAIAHERQGVGIPYAVVPENASQQDQDDADEWLKNLRANEQARLKYKKGWEFGFLDAKAGTNRNIMPSILHHDRQISKSVLAQFLELGSGGGGGSYSLSQDQTELLMLALQSVARHVANTLNKYAVKRLVDFNFTVEKYPKLCFTKIGKVDYNMLSTAIQRLAQTGLLTPEPSLERYLRDQMNLPPLPEEYEGVYLDRQEADKKKDEKLDEEPKDEESEDLEDGLEAHERLIAAIEKAENAIERIEADEA